jgi:hypothetical protein
MITEPDGFILSHTNDSKAEILDALRNLNTLDVSVWAGDDEAKNTFDPSICVTGKLEQHTPEEGSYRVVSDKGNYSYFDIENVDSVAVKYDGFGDGSAAVIKVEF